jgi:rhomboid protease GluP
MPCVRAVDTCHALPRAARAHKTRGVDRAPRRPQISPTVNDDDEAPAAAGSTEAAPPPAAGPAPSTGVAAEEALVRVPLVPTSFPVAPSFGSPPGWPSASKAFAGIRPPKGAARDDPFAGLTLLGPVAHERKARDWALVLQSSSIWHIVRRTQGGWAVLVRDADYRRSAGAIDRYEAENRDWPPPKTRERPRHAPSIIAPLVFGALIAFFLVTGPDASNSEWFRRGTAVTEYVLHSQPWRTVTALTLHADAKHVIGNAISGVVFASAVNRRLGPGGGSLAVLCSGILGNLANAVWHRADGGYASIGASTAIFGAVGVLAATQVMVDRSAQKNRRRSWIDIAGPLVGGLALLGALGSGGGPDVELGARINVDLYAHLFGFLSGVLVGLLASLPLRYRATVDFGSPGRGAASTTMMGETPRGWVQVVLGALAASVVLVAWEMAFTHRALG